MEKGESMKDVLLSRAKDVLRALDDMPKKLQHKWYAIIQNIRDIINDIENSRSQHDD